MYSCRNMQRDIEAAVPFIQSPTELKAAVISLYQAYAAPDGNTPHAIDAGQDTLIAAYKGQGNGPECTTAADQTTR
jgi:hypothetical protein